METCLALIDEEIPAFFAGIATKAGTWIAENARAFRSLKNINCKSQLQKSITKNIEIEIVFCC